jgi:hypothetical protein
MAGNFLWNISGIPDVIQGTGDIGTGTGKLLHGDILGATKRYGSALGHLGMGMMGYIPGLGHVSKGVLSAARTAKAMAAARKGTLMGKALGIGGDALRSGGSAIDAFKGFDIPRRFGYAGKLLGAKEFGKTMAGVSKAGPGSIAKLRNPFKKSFWTEGLPDRGKALAKYLSGTASPKEIQYARHAIPVLGAGAAQMVGPMLFSESKEEELPQEQP